MKISRAKINSALFYFLYFSVLAILLNNNFSLRQALSENEFAQTKVVYSQSGKPDEELINEIQKAEKYVYFAIYTITKENIVSALIAAKVRGLDVRGILDFNQISIPEEKPWVAKLKKYNVSLKIPEKESGLMHIKMLVTDKAYATGSFNWTVSGTMYNDEVLEIGRVESIRKKYLEIFETLYAKY